MANNQVIAELACEWWRELSKDDKYETGIRMDNYGDFVDESELIEAFHDAGE